MAGNLYLNDDRTTPGKAHRATRLLNSLLGDLLTDSALANAIRVRGLQDGLSDMTVQHMLKGSNLERWA